MEVFALNQLYVTHETLQQHPQAYQLQWRSGAVARGAVACAIALTVLSLGPGVLARTAYVTTSGYRLNVRSGPSTQYAVVRVLSDGQRIELTGRYENGWAQLTDGTWVAGNLVRVSSDQTVGGTPQTASVDTGGYRLNVRSGPSTQYAVVRVLQNGEAIQVTGRRQNGWAELTDGNWVAGNLIRTQAAAPTPPTPTPPNGGNEPTFQTLQYGDQGEAVLNLQRRLQTLGYFPSDLAPTGYYDAVTEAAVSAFQQANNLTVDSIAGPSTQAAIYSATSSNNPPPATTGTRTVATNGTSLNVRSGPGTSHRVINTLPNGTSVQLTGETSGGWVSLTSGGWVDSQWLR